MEVTSLNRSLQLYNSLWYKFNHTNLKIPAQPKLAQLLLPNVLNNEKISNAQSVNEKLFQVSVRFTSFGIIKFTAVPEISSLI